MAGRDQSAGSTRSQRISFRPRPIDISKPMPIIKTALDDEEPQDFRFLPIVSTGMDQAEESELHLQEIIQASLKMKHDELPEIPIPVVNIVDGYDTAPNPNPFQLGQTYILYHDKNDEELDELVEYDLDSDDEELVNQINKSATMNSTTTTSIAAGTNTSNTTTTPSKKPILTLDRFEEIMDRFEKEFYYYGKCDLTRAEAICKGLKPNFVQQIYQYWQNKRKQHLVNNTFLRRLLKPPDRDDPSAFKAFRPREIDTNKLKKARKNDAASLLKMTQLREEIERTRIISEMVKKREKLKKDYLLVVQELYERLVELAHIKKEEDDIPIVSVEKSSTSQQQQNILSSSTNSTSSHKKKKDRDERAIASSGATSNKEGGEISSTLQAILQMQENPTGPTFVNRDSQPLILANGKARQEGYRHFIVKPGEYPTSSLEKQYGVAEKQSLSSSTASSSSILAAAAAAADKSSTDKSSLAPSTTTVTDKSTTDIIMTEQPAVATTTPIDDEKEKEKRKRELDYFNSISIPTSNDYYESDEFDSEDSTTDSESEDESEFDYNQKIASIPPTKPQYNSMGKPIYPSLNQGYIFVNHNYPPVLGRARIGLYGKTYIDFIPINNNSSNSSSYTLNQNSKPSLNGGKLKPTIIPQNHQLNNIDSSNNSNQNLNSKLNNNNKDDNNDGGNSNSNSNNNNTNNNSSNNDKSNNHNQNNNNTNNQSDNNNNNDNNKNTDNINHNNMKSFSDSLIDSNHPNLDDSNTNNINININNNINNNEISNSITKATSSQLNNNDNINNNTDNNQNIINDNNNSKSIIENNSTNIDINEKNDSNEITGNKRKFQDTLANGSSNTSTPNKATKITDFEGFQVKNRNNNEIINSTDGGSNNNDNDNNSINNNNNNPNVTPNKSKPIKKISSPQNNNNSIDQYFTVVKKPPSTPASTCK